MGCKDTMKTMNFSLLLKPASHRCNLRCKYCFYLEKSAVYPGGALRMSDDTLDRLVSSFMAIPMRQHSFGWQGGEPTLMGLDFFKRVTELQKKYGRSTTDCKPTARFWTTSGARISRNTNSWWE